MIEKAIEEFKTQKPVPPCLTLDEYELKQYENFVDEMRAKHGPIEPDYMFSWPFHFVVSTSGIGHFVWVKFRNEVCQLTDPECL